MILLDTSVLIDALTGPRRSGSALRKAIEDGERILIPTLVLYEWLRGPRVKGELLAQESLFPRKDSVPFGPEESALAATLYGKVSHPRGREIDLAIAACAIVRAADLWTLNSPDFRDIPQLRLFSAS
ncbi:MAG TPA: PIN domain-containing protein [Pyrinomonadaceae bacterium]|jgi:predicted nucleic acid-binding protein